MFNLNFNVMKKILFGLMTMVALTFIAASAMGQGTNVTPFVDGTYSYTLGGLVLTGDATATVSYVGTNTPSISTPSIALTSASTDLTFTVDYTGATAGITDEYIRVDIQYDDASGTATAGCSNNIILNVMVYALPEIDLAIAGNGFECQNIGTATNNLSAANQPGIPDNTFTYTVTPNLTNIALGDAAFVSYDFTFTFDNELLGATTVVPSVTAGGGALTASGGIYTVTGATSETTITMTFPTTTGVAATDFTATVANGVLNVNGGNTYNETVTTNNEATVTVTPTPTIGTFTIE